MSRADELVNRPSESLSVELKRWIDPDEPQGRAKIVCTSLALWNHGGGYLVIGFDDETLQPDTDNAPEDVQSKFHIDKIQGLVSRYSSVPFEITVEFPERDGQLYPVISVPSGVKTPVAAKRDFEFGGRKLINVDAVYIRSLLANNTPSTTRAKWNDWPKIVEVCFDNREADIGRFLRRHLSGVSPEVIQGIASSIVSAHEPEPTGEEALMSLLQDGMQRFENEKNERRIELPDHGSWEAGLRVIGDVPPHAANQSFLSLIDSSNPSYTGWPIWLVSQGFTDDTARPYVHDGLWEAFIASNTYGRIDHLDFLRFDPNGCFYLYRGLSDDFSRSERAPPPLTALEFGLPVLRVAEAIAVGIAIVKAMGCNIDNTQLGFVFRWTKLRGRELTAWAHPGRDIRPGRMAHQNELVSSINVPLDIPLAALGGVVSQVVRPLFEVFDGFELGDVIVDELTNNLLERRL